MFPLDLFAEHSRTLWNVRSPIGDIDETDASMSSDDASEADLLDSGANSDTGRRANDMSFARCPDALATLDAELKGLHRHNNRRRERSLACYSAYSLPSREERREFKRQFRRKKEMFVDEPHLPFVHALVRPAEILLTNQFASQCHVVENEPTLVDSVLTSASMPFDERRSADSENTVLGGTTLGYFDLQRTASRLKIKIPGLVDRLALRLRRSCQTGQAEEDEDVDALASLDSYCASETSSSDGDIDDDDDYDCPSRCSSAVEAPRPDRSSRRKLRRCVASPYSRIGGKPKRKELWVDVDISAGSEPAFPLASPTSDRPRVLRSGRHW
ncbi:hypothetical protein BC827DRAFT_814261 [Russula dissimulans]|nr:hypothetical protein BC827DRAFT_814261 [Russula dissimulans]